jgi:type VI secretion system protein VasI
VWPVVAALLASLPAMLPSLVLAQARAPETCVPISDPLKRLACYDAIFIPDTNTSADTVPWKLETSVSAISGRTNVRLTVSSDEVVPVDYGAAVPATLVLHCDENITSAMFSFGGNYMSEVGEYGTISYRLDDTSALTVKGKVSADNKLIGLTDGASAIPFVRRLLPGKSLLIQVNPVNKDGTPVTVHFNIDGLDKAIAPLRQSCGW